MFGHNVSDIQTDLSVGGGAITGTLKHVSTGALARDWGPGNFMALAPRRLPGNRPAGYTMEDNNPPDYLTLVVKELPCNRSYAAGVAPRFAGMA